MPRAITATTNLSSLYENPTDNKPANLDISKFLHKSETAKTSDLDIINEAMKQHATIENIMQRRMRNMRNLYKWWAQGNVSSAINALT